MKNNKIKANYELLTPCRMSSLKETTIPSQRTGIEITFGEAKDSKGAPRVVRWRSRDPGPRVEEEEIRKSSSSQEGSLARSNDQARPEGAELKDEGLPTLTNAAASVTSTAMSSRHTCRSSPSRRLCAGDATPSA